MAKETAFSIHCATDQHSCVLFPCCACNNTFSAFMTLNIREGYPSCKKVPVCNFQTRILGELA